jgi:anti-repressor protein
LKLEVTTFRNPEFGEIRAVLINGAIWFVGKDSATALGYSNTKAALADHVDDEDKRILQRSEIATLENHLSKDAFPVNFVRGDVPNRGLTIINESGLYSLILSSKLPGAKRFKRWVTAEILPSVRTHGAYMTPEVIERTLTDPDYIIQLATTLKMEQQKRRALEEKVKADAPAVFFAEAVTGADTNILIRDMAKLLAQNGADIGGNRLYEVLRRDGYLIKSGSDYNMPTQRAMELGLFFVKETPRIAKEEAVIDRTTKVTPKGQKYFINRYAPKKALEQ